MIDRLHKVNAWHLFIISLVVRLLYTSLHLWQNGVVVDADAADYAQFAQFILDQGWMVEDISQLNAHSGPGYPWVMALDLLLFSSMSFPLTIGLQILFNSLTPVVFYHLGRTLQIKKSMMLVFGFWMAIYLQHIRYAPLLTKENLVFCLLPLSVLLLIRLRQQLTWVNIVSWSATYGFLIHIDERYFFFLPVLIIYVFWKKESWQWKSVTALVFSLAVVMTPWLYRNWVVYERPVILTERVSPFTDKLLGYTTPVNPHRVDKPHSYDRSNLPLYESITDSLQKGLALKNRWVKFIATMKRGIRDGNPPRTYSRMEARWHEFAELLRPIRFNGGYTANGYRYFPPWKFSSNLIYGIQYGSILLLACLGLILYARYFTLEWWILFALLGLHIFLHSFIGFGLQRYRVPVDFIFFLFATLPLGHGKRLKGAERV
jgi:hypothetical protein